MSTLIEFTEWVYLAGTKTTTSVGCKICGQNIWSWNTGGFESWEWNFKDILQNVIAHRVEHE